MKVRLQNGARRQGLTLVELLVVILIILLVSAVTLPTIVSSFNHRQVSEAARILQGGLVGARDVAINTNAPAGIRLLPDPAFTGINPTTGRIDPTQIRAANRFVPLQLAPDYSEGRVSILQTDPTAIFSVDPTTYFMFPGSNGKFSYPFGGSALLFLQEQIHQLKPPYLVNSPTSWYWNIRVGDKIQINGSGNWYTIVGPMNVENPEGFVNVGPPGTQPPTYEMFNGVRYFPEVLFLVNGLDDNHDGYIDNGFDGIDNDGDGLIDQVGPPYNTVNALNEWTEHEVWHAAYDVLRPREDIYDMPYIIARRPVVAPGARETLLPGGVVVDLTHIPSVAMERSRVPVDAMSGAVDILLNASGQVVPNSAYSSPTAFGMDSAFYHFWLAERGDLYPIGGPLIKNLPFRLPMPYGASYTDYSSGTVTPNYYDNLVANNPTLPVLKGEIRILTLFTRTGQLVTTDTPVFDVNNVNHPFLAAQRGARGQ